MTAKAVPPVNFPVQNLPNSCRLSDVQPVARNFLGIFNVFCDVAFYHGANLSSFGDITPIVSLRKSSRSPVRPHPTAVCGQLPFFSQNSSRHCRQKHRWRLGCKSFFHQIQGRFVHVKLPQWGQGAFVQMLDWMGRKYNASVLRCLLSMLGMAFSWLKINDPCHFHTR